MENVDFIRHTKSVFKEALNGKATLLNFLNENEIEIVKKISKEFDIECYFDGGFINAENQRCLISSYEALDFKIIIYKIIYNKKYYNLSHRQILGSLMSLGIKRECIGDIYIDESNNCYFAATKEISPFLLQEANYISNAPIKLEVVLDKIEIIKKYEDRKLFVASLRLDVLICSVYNISRKEALDIILQSDVKVNHVVCLNPTRIINKDDLISVKHYGRFIYKDDCGKSRSDRIVALIALQV